MKNFDVDERVTEHGARLKITTKNGLTFEDGSSSTEVIVRDDYGPRVGERVMCGNTLVKVEQKRYDQSDRLMLMDEDTKAWFVWE